MNTLTLHDLESAPTESKPLLENSLKSFGMIPNLHGVLASSPGLLEAYQTLGNLFQNSSFNNDELTVVWQTINVEHECLYCVPAHTAIANMMKVDPALTQALRDRKTMTNDKLQVLHQTTLLIVRNRGHLSDAEIESFYAAGYEERQILEIILGVSQKVISNYANHIAATPVDKSFQQYSWQS
jgi:alkylhydroperoxidase family enzyme